MVILEMITRDRWTRIGIASDNVAYDYAKIDLLITFQTVHKLIQHSSV